MITTLDMLWKGLAIGVIISAPMGPVGMLCIQKTIAKGRKAGLMTGCGAALSDILYCLLTGFGLSLIEEFLERNQSVIQILGSIVLLFFGIYLYRQRQQKEYAQRAVARASVSKDGVGGFLFTLSNPLIIFLIIGLFARFNFLSPDIKFYHYITGYIAILGGALGWWWLVTFIISRVRNHFNATVQMWVNRIIGIVIMIFALVGIATASSDLLAAPPHPESLRELNETYTTDLVIPGGKNVADGQNEIRLTLPDIIFPCRVLFHIDPVGRGSRLPHFFRGLKHDDAPRDMLRLKFTNPDNPESATIFTFTDSELPPDRTSAVTLSRRDGVWTLHNPKTSANHIVSGSEGISATELVIENLSGHQICFPYLSIGIPIEERSIAFAKSVAEYADSLRGIRTPHPLNGRWKLLSAEYDSEKAFPGGDYVIEVTTPKPDIHIIDYFSGATINPGNWESGQVKGVLFDHETTDNYYLYWIDAEGNLLHKNLTAEYDTEKDLLRFTFPHHETKMTFFRLPVN